MWHLDFVLLLRLDQVNYCSSVTANYLPFGLAISLYSLANSLYNMANSLYSMVISLYGLVILLYGMEISLSMQLSSKWPHSQFEIRRKNKNWHDKLLSLYLVIPISAPPPINPQKKKNLWVADWYFYQCCCFFFKDKNKKNNMYL